MRVELVGPNGFASVRIARENRRRPFVVALTLIGIPWSGIPRAVEDQVGLRVVADPTPDGAAADLPTPRRPGRDAEVVAFRARVIGMKFRTDQHVFVGTDAITTPNDLAGVFIKSGDPPSHAHFAARVADKDFS